MREVKNKGEFSLFLVYSLIFSLFSCTMFRKMDCRGGDLGESCLGDAFIARNGNAAEISF